MIAKTNSMTALIDTLIYSREETIYAYIPSIRTRLIENRCEFTANSDIQPHVVHYKIPLRDPIILIRYAQIRSMWPFDNGYSQLEHQIRNTIDLMRIISSTQIFFDGWWKITTVVTTKIARKNSIYTLFWRSSDNSATR